MSRKTFRIFLNSYLENFTNISNFLFANFADLLDFLQLCHLLNFVCQPCRSFRCGRRYPASRSVLRPSSWGSGCALGERGDDHEMDEEGWVVEAMVIIIVMMKRASVRSWCVFKNAIMMITMMVEQTSLRLKRLQWWLKKPVWAPCSLSSNRSRWSFHFWRRVIEKSYSWRGKICSK